MRLFRLAVLPLALAAAIAAPAASAEAKIGALNFNVLLRDAPQVKAAEQKFKIEFDKRDQDLQAEKKKFQEDAKKYQRDADSMSAQQKAATEKDLFSRRQDLELKERTLNDEAGQRNQQLQRAFIDQIGKALEQVVKDKQLDLVIRDPAFVSPAYDITQDVLKVLASMPDAAPADDASGKKKKKK